MSKLFEFVLLVLASGAVVDVWRKGSLFAKWRAHVDLWTGFFGELLRCAYCLSYHIPWILLVLIEIPALLLGPWWATVGWYVITALAVTRVSLLLDAALPERMRYHRSQL